MSHELSVRHLDGDRFAIDIRGHQIHPAQLVDASGADTAPTPTGVFIAGLASCVAFYARRYLARHNIDLAGLAVAASFTIGGRPTRVTDVAVRLTPPPALPAEHRDAFYAVAAGCTVHHTLEQPPLWPSPSPTPNVTKTADSRDQRPWRPGRGTANPKRRDRSASAVGGTRPEGTTMMRHGGWSGADWVLMGVGMLVFWTLVVAGVVWLVRGLRAPVSRSAYGQDEQT